jgi:hypothetical protein
VIEERVVQDSRICRVCLWWNTEKGRVLRIKEGMKVSMIGRMKGEREKRRIEC